MSKACALLSLVLSAAVASAAPAPFPKQARPVDSAALLQKLRERGIVVEAVNLSPGNGELVLRLKLRLVLDSEECERVIDRTIEATGADVRTTLCALLAEGKDASGLWKEQTPLPPIRNDARLLN